MTAKNPLTSYRVNIKHWKRFLYSTVVLLLLTNFVSASEATNFVLPTALNSPASILHAKLEKTIDVNQAVQLAFETTKNMPYPQLFDFWEEGCKKEWPDVKGAAIAEIANRWKEKPEMRVALDYVIDVKKNPSFRLELVDALGYHKRKIGPNERLELLNSFKQIVAEDSNSSDVRASACHRLAGIALLMKERQELKEDDHLLVTSLLSRTLMNEQQPIELRSEAAHSLGVLKYYPAEQNLLDLLEKWHNLDMQLMRSVILGLGRLKSKAAVPKISEVLQETTQMPLYATAAVSLGMIGGTDVIEPLVKNRLRFPIPCCRSALIKNKDNIKTIIDGHDKTCTLETGLEAYCLAAGEREWQEVFELLPSLNITAKKKVLRMAVELSPNLDGMKPILEQIKKPPENKELYEYADILLARMRQPTVQIDAQTGNTQVDIIPPAPNNQKGDRK